MRRLIIVCLLTSLVVSRAQFSEIPGADPESDSSRFDDGGQTQEAPEKEDEIPLEIVIDALRRILEYFHENLDDLNLDGVIGPRIAEGQLNVLLRRLLSKDYTPMIVSTHEINEIYDVTESLKNVAKNAIARLIVNEPEYYRSLSPLVEAGRWELNYPMKKTNPLLVWPVVAAEETMNETWSDICLGQMLGSGRSEGHPCTPSDPCWDMMTQPHSSQYSLTHEIIFLQMGETTGCWETMKDHTARRNQGNVWNLQEIFCANVLREVKELYAKGNPERRHDLFMEQAAICGLYGYYEFFNFSYLKNILSWQKPIGCYGRSDTEILKLKEQKRHLMKRAEHDMPDGCLSHRSSVAVAVLGLYIRFMVEDPTLTGKSRFNFN